MRSRPAFGAALLALAMLGCSGGGPSGSPPAPPAQPPTQPPAGSPTLQVLPTSFNFGRVTTGNAALVAPLEVTVRNTGTVALTIAQISEPTTPDFRISLGGGSRPCNSQNATVAAGDHCTFLVTFQPTGNGAFTAAVNVTSNGGNAGLPLSGTSEAVSGSLTVRINQITTACSSSPNATAYVSVTDQGGFPVLGLNTGNFDVTQPPSTTDLLLSASFLDAAYQPIAIATALDHSSSLTDQPVAFADMKRGVSEFLAGLRTGDLGEVVNFDSEVEVVQPFTADKALLQAAALANWDKGGSTRLYDAVDRAIDDAATQSPARRAVIVTTDGVNTITGSVTLEQAIANGIAKNVPVFTVGLGSTIDATVLEKLAEDTGGIFYRADVSQNLATIYRQLSSVLFEKQYVLTFNQLPKGSVGVVSPVTVRVTGPTGSSGTSPPVNIASCN